MNIEEVRDYCLGKQGVTEEFPFGPETLVFKVMGKMFLLTGLDESPCRCNLKMAAELVPEFREKYPEVQPGYHMNKKYWNSVTFEQSSIPHKQLLWMIDHSYEQVVKGLPKQLRETLNNL